MGWQTSQQEKNALPASSTTLYTLKLQKNKQTCQDDFLGFTQKVGDPNFVTFTLITWFMVYVKLTACPELTVFLTVFKIKIKIKDLY